MLYLILVFSVSYGSYNVGQPLVPYPRVIVGPVQCRVRHGIGGQEGVQKGKSVFYDNLSLCLVVHQETMIVAAVFPVLHTVYVGV